MNKAMLNPNAHFAPAWPLFSLLAVLTLSAAAFAQNNFPASQPDAGLSEQDFSHSLPSDWHFETTLSGGFSDVHFNGKSAIPYNPIGGYIDLNGYAKMPTYESPIVGFGLTASGNWDDYTITYPNTAPFYSSFVANTAMYSAEVRFAFPFGVPDLDDGLYVLPRLGIGALVTNFTVAQPYLDPPFYPFGLYTTHTGIAVEVRPDIEIGYRIRRFNIACEASYMAAWGNFGKLGNVAQDVRVGLLIGYRF
jgi:hypothetical protein